MIVGQTVYVKKIGDNARYYRNNNLPIPIDEHKVIKIARKYFYLDGSLSDYAFSKETHNERTEYSHQYKVYESMQAIEDEKEYEEKIRLIKDKFDYCRSPNLTLNQVRSIHDILTKKDF